MPLTNRSRRFYGYRFYGYVIHYNFGDLMLWVIPLFLTILSGILIASTQRQAQYVEWYHHWITAVIGIELSLFIGRIPLDKWKSVLVHIYALTVVSLAAVRIIGTSALGAQRWISIAGFHVQPSEFAKLAVILLLAGVLSNNPPKHFTDFLLPTVVMILPWFLVFIQPDLGTSLVFGAILMVMLFWSGMRLNWMIILLSPIITALLSAVFPFSMIIWIPISGYIAHSSLSWKRFSPIMMMLSQGLISGAASYLWVNVLKSYQRDRLILFMEPNRDPLGGGYHLLQSKIGIGSGGFFGTGLMQGQFTKLQFIPEQHTDFIFSALGEETGFVGCLLVITSFMLLAWKLLQIATLARTNFESLVVVGIAAMLMFEVFVNISMTIGLGPITGIPLPWMSYGRSAIIVNFLSLGLCTSVSRRNQRPSNW